ncbi:MAG: VOC family protein [Dehalococcoidia bacterium]|nr:VOC family protein [Dehalococcoidia bacterium]
MPTYSYDHIHLRTQDPMATARWYNEMFGAEIIESVQTDGQARIDLDINGLTIFIARADESATEAPGESYLGLDHFGLLVDDIEEAAADLKAKGAEFSTEPFQLRPGLKIAYVLAPENVRIELLERD